MQTRGGPSGCCSEPRSGHALALSALRGALFCSASEVDVGLQVAVERMAPERTARDAHRERQLVGHGGERGEPGSEPAAAAPSELTAGAA